MDTKYEAFLSDNDFNKLKDSGQRLLDRYASPEQFDNLSKAQGAVGEIKVEMQQNVNRLIQNQGEFDNLEDQTREMKDNADDFNKKAKNLEREMFWRKFRYAAIAIGIVLAIIIIIVLSVVLTR